ncbi:MAG: TM2 domain-containing protein [Shewanella sp.]|uniref:TM2 domain-containing protein n=1 Tax=Shewanella sp. SNU WT4 TaxID=2590015 RepID=UPI00112ECE1A|nr:TM2 domain-containing protein [Shewanella sp. SNU WT4]QDF65939.1 TM2 domain-containing protein [Shewanella sp. SNU WT4]
MQTQLCNQCGATIAYSDLTCHQCQCDFSLDALAGIDPSLHLKSQKLTAWFSLLLGGVGAHRFYLGQPLKGSLYLAFCWTLIPSVVGWFDAFKTFTMDPVQFKLKYCRRSHVC